jgi:hypothetical protein
MELGRGRLMRHFITWLMVAAATLIPGFESAVGCRMRESAAAHTDSFTAVNTATVGPGTQVRNQRAARRGRVRVAGNSLIDDGGPFLGLGVSYFTALWRHKHDRPRLESDLAFLSRAGGAGGRALRGIRPPDRQGSAFGAMEEGRASQACSRAWRPYSDRAGTEVGRAEG